MYCQIGNVREHFTQGSYYLADYPALAMRDNPNNQEDIHELSGYPDANMRTGYEQTLFDSPALNVKVVTPNFYPSNDFSLDMAYRPFVGPGSNINYMKNWSDVYKPLMHNIPNTTLYPATQKPIKPSPKPTIPFIPYSVLSSAPTTAAPTTAAPTTAAPTTAVPTTAAPTTKAPAPHIDLSLFFPPIIDGTSYTNCQTYALIYYIGSYYYMIKINPKLSKDNIKPDNYVSLYKNNKEQLNKHYSDNENLLNPIYNYIYETSDNNDFCSATNEYPLFPIGPCDIKTLFINSKTTSYSYDEFELNHISTNKITTTVNKKKVTTITIKGCDKAYSKINTKHKIKLFSGIKLNYIYYKNDINKNCEIDFTYNDISKKNIIHTIKHELNNGNPIICAIEYSDKIKGKHSYYGYFTDKIENKKSFPKVSENAIITKASFDPNDKTLIKEIITIAGYSDNIGDGTGAFKIVTSYGKNVGINGTGFISYDCFFTTKSEGGIIRSIISVG
jgi:hypothetical protein